LLLEVVEVAFKSRVTSPIYRTSSFTKSLFGCRACNNIFKYFYTKAVSAEVNDSEFEIFHWHTFKRLSMGQGHIRLDSKRRRKLLVGSVAVTALCAQYATLLMATQASTSTGPALVAPERANWSDEEVTTLVNYLYENRAAAGDGGNFKQTIFNAVAVEIAPLLKQGAKKTGVMCKTKWASVKQVCISLIA
jgi:hypothetical protein